MLDTASEMPSHIKPLRQASSPRTSAGRKALTMSEAVAAGMSANASSVASGTSPRRTNHIAPVTPGTAGPSARGASAAPDRGGSPDPTEFDEQCPGSSTRSRDERTQGGDATDAQPNPCPRNKAPPTSAEQRKKPSSSGPSPILSEEYTPLRRSPFVYVQHTGDHSSKSALKVDAKAFVPFVSKHWNMVLSDPLMGSPELEDSAHLQQKAARTTSISSSWKIVGNSSNPNSTSRQPPAPHDDEELSNASSADPDREDEELQLPVSLQADLGIDNFEEMVKVFKRASVSELKQPEGSFVDWSSATGNPAKVRSPPSLLERRPSWLAQPIPFVSHKQARPEAASSGSPSLLPYSQPSAAANTKAIPIKSRRHSVVDSMLLSGYQPGSSASVPVAPSNPPSLSSSFDSKRKHQTAAAGGGGIPLAYFMPSDSFEHRPVPIAKKEHAGVAASFYGEFGMATHQGPLYTVEFKAGRTEVFYVHEQGGIPSIEVKLGDCIIVEADRGEDLGRVTGEVSIQRLRQIMSGSGPIRALGAATVDVSKFKSAGFVQTIVGEGIPFDTAAGLKDSEIAGLLLSKELVPKCIHRMAVPGDMRLLQAKAQEEALAMVRCQSRIRQRKLPMDIVDAEYQWDRNKLTFYFAADRRIDFRELVRDLFRIYKTRIWMCAVDRARLESLAGTLAAARDKPELDTYFDELNDSMFSDH